MPCKFCGNIHKEECPSVAFVETALLKGEPALYKCAASKALARVAIEAYLKVVPRTRPEHPGGMCDSCAGEVRAMDGGSCMCGGTGRADDAVCYLREKLVKAERDLNDIKNFVHDIMEERRQ